MRRILTTLALAGSLALGASGQNWNRVENGQEIPEGVVVYHLPSTTLRLTVEAIHEQYTPGPYAEYAKKYLGIDVPQKESSKYILSKISMTPYLEADRSCSYIVNLDGFGDKTVPAYFFKFASQGLVMLSDTDKGSEDSWRFPSLAQSQESLSTVATGNLTSVETTLYRTVRNDNGEYERLAYTQSQTIEKSPEKKAKEAASMILSLRQNRINIITGNTDATFSGDALRAAVEEIRRVEDQLMQLFTGQTETSVEVMSLDVLPESTGEEELTIAFRLSDTHGILPSDDISGRPIVMEIEPENMPAETFTDQEDSPAENQVISETRSNRNRARQIAGTRGDIFYRVPAICTIRITDGQETLLESRVPVYQKGQDMTFPVSTLVK